LRFLYCSRINTNFHCFQRPPAAVGVSPTACKEWKFNFVIFFMRDKALLAGLLWEKQIFFMLLFYSFPHNLFDYSQLPPP
jgi:hypothetical protein